MDAKPIARDWHVQAIETIKKALKTNAQGLTVEEAQKRLHVFGHNRLPQADREHLLKRWLLQFHHLLIYVLLFAAATTLFLKHWIDASVILSVVLINSIIGVIQEGKAQRAIDLIREALAPNATVIRNNKRVSIPASRLVPGDVVILEAGDKVSADIRLFEVYGLRLQESILTGESLPVSKQTEPVTKDTLLAERSCMAYSGSMVVGGQAKGIVVATGEQTEVGGVNRLLATIKPLSMPLVDEMTMFTRWLTLFILFLSGLVLAWGHLTHLYSFSYLLMAVVGLAVAAIPEGLPAVLTITLAIGVQKMAKRHVIIRKLASMEAVGTLNVICTDKTGTLTRNEMVVERLVTSQQMYQVTGLGYAPEGEIACQNEPMTAKDVPVFADIARVALLCNDARIDKIADTWQAHGDPMEGALLAFAAKCDNALNAEDWMIRHTIPFDTQYQLMAKLADHAALNLSVITVKGAPEKMLNLCQQQKNENGTIEPIDRYYWQRQIEAITHAGQRALALAINEMPSKDQDLNLENLGDHLIWVGLVGLMDPPRPEVASAIEECYQAGIQIKMITGDHLGTACAIAQEIGIKNPTKVLSGHQLDVMSDDELKQIVLETNIYARTTPEHKLRLVTALQSHGFIVGMTGDGVNDTPALKQANIGIAMGKKGSDAAKEVADLVLADDHFASIVSGVREGRTVYDNIKKVIGWTLPTNGGEAAIIILALLMNTTLPITPLQILWINLITAITLGLALAFEPTEMGTMLRKPRRVGASLLTKSLAWHIVFVSTLFVLITFGMFSYILDTHHDLILARTMTLNTLVVLEIFHLFYIRNIYGTSFTLRGFIGTPMIWLIISITTAAQFAITYFSPLQQIFLTTSVSLKQGAWVILIGAVFFLVLEAEKQFRLRTVALFAHEV